MPPLTNHAKLSGQGTAGPTAGQLKQFFVDQSIPDSAVLFLSGVDTPNARNEFRPDGWIITARW